MPHFHVTWRICCQQGHTENFTSFTWLNPVDTNGCLNWIKLTQLWDQVNSTSVLHLQRLNCTKTVFGPGSAPDRARVAHDASHRLRLVPHSHDHVLLLNWYSFFLTCVCHTAHIIAIGWMSARPSVSLSVRHTLLLRRNGSTYRQTAVFTGWYPRDSSFLKTKLFPGIPMRTLPTWALNARGRKVAISDQYLAIARKRLKIDG